MEEILEPEKGTPMDASEATAEAAHSPPRETADSTIETPVPMKTEAPEGSPHFSPHRGYRWTSRSKNLGEMSDRR